MNCISTAKLSCLLLCFCALFVPFRSEGAGVGLILAPANVPKASEGYPPFQCEGWLATQTLDPKGKVITKAEYRFMFAASNSVWLQRHVDVEVVRGGKHGPEYAETFFDGIDIFRITFHSDDTLKKMQQHPDPGLRPVMQNEGGTIVPGMFPTFASYFESMVWLAFASQPYFDKVTNNLMPVFFGLAGFLKVTEANQFHFELAATNADLNSSRIVRFFPTLAPVEIPKKVAGTAAVRLGITAAYKPRYYWEFRVLQSTNILNHQVPLHFEYLTYAALKDSPSDTNYFVHSRTEGKTTQAMPLALNTPFVVNIRGAVNVTDWRLERASGKPAPLFYMETNKHLLQRGDPNFVSAIMARVPKPREEKQMDRRLVMFIVALFLLPLLWLSRRAMANKPTQDNSV